MGLGVVIQVWGSRCGAGGCDTGLGVMIWVWGSQCGAGVHDIRLGVTMWGWRVTMWGWGWAAQRGALSVTLGRLGHNTGLYPRVGALCPAGPRRAAAADATMSRRHVAPLCPRRVPTVSPCHVPLPYPPAVSPPCLLAMSPCRVPLPCPLAVPPTMSPSYPPAMSLPCPLAVCPHYVSLPCVPTVSPRVPPPCPCRVSPPCPRRVPPPCPRRRGLCHAAEAHRGAAAGAGPALLRRDRPGPRVPAQLRHRPPRPQA